MLPLPKTRSYRMRRLVLILVLAAGTVPASAQAWSWPAEGQVLRPFVCGDDPYAGGQHRGIDIGGDLGSGVLAPASGSVSFAGTVPKGGKTLSIRTPDGYTVVMQHLGSFDVRKGDAVAEGDAVATVGTSGEPDWPEPYVYLSVRLTADEQGYVDPLTLLPARIAPEPAPPPSGGTGPDPAEPPASAPVPPVAAHPRPPAVEPPATAPAQPAPTAPAPGPVAAPKPAPPPSIAEPLPGPRSVGGGTQPGEAPVFVPASPPATAPQPKAPSSPRSGTRALTAPSRRVFALPKSSHGGVRATVTQPVGSSASVRRLAPVQGDSIARSHRW